MYSSEEEQRQRLADALNAQNGPPQIRGAYARNLNTPRTYQNGGHWAGTDTPVSDQDLAAGLNTASDRDVMGAGNYGVRGWAHDHPLGVMAAMTAAAFGGAALSGAGAGAGAGAGGGAAGGGATAAGGGGSAAAGGGAAAGGSSMWMKAAPMAMNMMSNNQSSAPNYAPPSNYQPVQFRDTFKEGQEKRKQARLAASLSRGARHA